MSIKKYRSTKQTDKYSVCYRQPNSGTHCSFLHGYAIYFKFVFECQTLDERNWVQDFGFISRTEYKVDGLQLKEWFKYMFDHTTLISKYDPYIDLFKGLDDEGLIQLRLFDGVGCEKLAELVFYHIKQALKLDTGERVKLIEVECFEHEKNSAIYTEI